MGCLAGVGLFVLALCGTAGVVGAVSNLSLDPSVSAVSWSVVPG
ncbi:hypothetical protein OG756_29845 [Streptomyces sp. NBC_01310]|nr:hypothetical protein OG756_29845 [Streptomyces sp. NBC_01310]